MLTVACCLWDANENTPENSRCFDESWVEKLYRGFKRNLTWDFRFACLTDRWREFKEPIDQYQLDTKTPHFGCLIEPFKLNAVPMIICGLDMVVLGNIDHFADYCLSGGKIAAPKDPYKPTQLINPFVLAPAGHTDIFYNWRGENDMDWLRQQPHAFIDDLFPGGQTISLKAGDVRRKGTQNARVVYCHGRPKMHELDLPWIRENWV